MKTPRLFLRGGLLSIVLAGFISWVSFPASAQTSKPAATKSPALTAEQQKYVAARQKCLDQYARQKIPRSQTHTFLSACMKDAGFKKAVALPPIPPQPSKSSANK
jgi:hypothetical protein